MKTARWLILATCALACVMSSRVANGQYEEGVPPVFLPQASNGRTVTNASTSNSGGATPMLSQMMQSEGNVAQSVGCGGCDGSCNEFGLLCNESGQQQGGQIGSSYFGRNRGAGRIKFSVNRGPRACDQCGCDNRTFLQRILPISINIQSNHESRYIGFFGGYHDLQDIRAVDRLLEFDDSFILGFTRGRRFCGNIRLESEFAIRNSPVGDYFEGAFVGEDFVPTATYAATDGFFALSSMRNVLIDFNNIGTRVTPYAGIGLGGVAVTGDFINGTLGRADWINDAAFAYQFIVGATRKLNNRSEAYAEFRHFGTSGLDLENDAGDPVTSFAYQNNTVVFGLRLNRPARSCCGN